MWFNSRSRNVNQFEKPEKKIRRQTWNAVALNTGISLCRHRRTAWGASCRFACGTNVKAGHTMTTSREHVRLVSCYRRFLTCTQRLWKPLLHVCLFLNVAIKKMAERIVTENLLNICGSDKHFALKNINEN